MHIYPFGDIFSIFPLLDPLILQQVLARDFILIPYVLYKFVGVWPLLMYNCLSLVLNSTKIWKLSFYLFSFSEFIDEKPRQCDMFSLLPGCDHLFLSNDININALSINKIPLSYLNFVFFCISSDFWLIVLVFIMKVIVFLVLGGKKI